MSSSCFIQKQANFQGCARHGGWKGILSFQTLAVFIITKNILDERDQDVHDAYELVDEDIASLKTVRETIDSVFRVFISKPVVYKC